MKLTLSVLFGFDTVSYYGKILIKNVTFKLQTTKLIFVFYIIYMKDLMEKFLWSVYSYLLEYFPMR